MANTGVAVAASGAALASTARSEETKSQEVRQGFDETET